MVQDRCLPRRPDIRVTPGYPDLFTLSAPSRKCKPGRSGPQVIYQNPDRLHWLCVVRLLTDTHTYVDYKLRCAFNLIFESYYVIIIE